jgi:NAD(P)H-dependent flavin oxidoreductase YrpB (nitropropane dioxygenase family)
LVEELRLERPIVQAGMGGGIAGGELAGAVSAAGGLGTVGILPPQSMRRELRRARELAPGNALAANLLVPFARRSHVEACAAARVEAVVLHGGFSKPLVEQLQSGGASVLQTVGTPEEARRALGDGADALIVQGIEAGGHLVGVEPALEALARILPIAGGKAVWLAGGIADPDDVRRALDAGAQAAVAGTRFLLTHESGAHPAYKQAVLTADRTLETQLFGLGWPMRHRVVPNAATERWCRPGQLVSPPLKLLQRVSSPIARLPMALASAPAKFQRAALPIYGPSPPTRGTPEALVEVTALYAGETALRMRDVIPAAEAVSLLGSPTMRST